MDKQNSPKRTVRIEAVLLPETDRLGALVLAGQLLTTLTGAQAERMKPFEGTEMEPEEIHRLLGQCDWQISKSV